VVEVGAAFAATSPQEVDVTLSSSSSSGTWIFGAGTVFVSATLFAGNDLFVNGSTGKAEKAGQHDPRPPWPTPFTI
jgi:hypothetical protein